MDSNNKKKQAFNLDQFPKIDHSKTCLGMILPRKCDVDYCIKNNVLTSTTSLIQESHFSVSPYSTLYEFTTIFDQNCSPLAFLENKVTKHHPENVIKYEQQYGFRRYITLDTGAIVLLSSAESKEVHLCVVTGKMQYDSGFICSKDTMTNKTKTLYPNNFPMQITYTWASRNSLPQTIYSRFSQIHDYGFALLFRDKTAYGILAPYAAH